MISDLRFTQGGPAFWQGWQLSAGLIGGGTLRR
jgi:hypothetical protein